MNNIFFVSSLLHPSFQKHVHYSIASENYQRKVIEATNFKKIYSINAGNIQDTLLEDGNIAYYAFSAKKIQLLAQLIKLGFSIKKEVNKTDPIVFYNITSRSIFVYCILRFIYRLKCFVIVADYNPPHKDVLSRLVHKCLQSSSGILALSPQIKLHQNITYQQLLLRTADVSSTAEKVIPRHMLMSGSLGKTTGLTVAVEAMKYIPNYHLHISGPLFDISEEEFADILSRGGKNITYHGLLPTIEYSRLLQNCSICLSLRNPDDEEHQFNFPSKIGEYLQAGKIVISSIAYAGFEQAVYITNWDAYSLSQTVQSISHDKPVSGEWLLAKFGLAKFRSNLHQIFNNAIS